MFQGNSQRSEATSKAEPSSSHPHDEAKRLFEEAQEELMNLAGAGAIGKVHKAVSLIDGAPCSPSALRVRVRTEAADMLAQYGHPAHAEALLSAAIQILRTASCNVTTGVIAKLQLYRGELLYQAGCLSEAETCFRTGLDYLTPCSAPSIQAKLGLALIALKDESRAVTTIRSGTLMSEVFSECSRAAAQEHWNISETLVKAAKGFMEEGWFEEAAYLAKEALSIYQQTPECSYDACRMLRLFIAEAVHKAGFFTQALELRQSVLGELRSDQREGPKSALVLEVTQSMAETLIELKSFERAEALLCETLTAAKEQGLAERAFACGALLMRRYMECNMEQELAALREAMSEILPDLGPVRAILAQLDNEIVFNADPESRLIRLDQLLEESKLLSGAERVLTESALLATKAMDIAAAYPEVAQELILQVLNRLETIPAPFDEGIRDRLALAQASLAIAQSDPHMAVRVISRQLEELERNEGKSSYTLRLKLMLCLGEALKSAGETTQALATAHKAVGLCEERNDTNSLPFAEALLFLSTLLPDDSPEWEAAIERAVPIVERYRHR